MPGYVQHIVWGQSFSILTLLALKGVSVPISNEILAISIAIAALFSIFPDIDHKRTRMYGVYQLFGLAVISALIVTETGHAPGLMAALLLSWAITHKHILGALKPRHRGITHKAYTAVIFSIIVALLSERTLGTPIPGMFAFAGYMSHIIADRL